MKFRHFACAFGERELASLTCKRLRRTLVPVGLKSFIRSESGTREPESSEYEKKEFTQAEAPVGGTRWNPTPEQIRILEMLYCGGMRTPHAPQIEQITAQLAKYGKIEGKNVFYWFQNHKARERQKKKRTGLRPLPPPSPSITSPSPVTTYEEEEEDRTLELFPLHPEGKIN